MSRSQLPLRLIISSITSHFKIVVSRILCEIGIVACVYYLIYLSRSILLNVKAFVLPKFNYTRENFVDKYGPWAVVTGATDGIGLAYAKELASRRVNIVLISRSEEKLKKIAAEIENKFVVQTKIITADFTEGRHVYERIENGLKDLSIGILVNNVGIYVPYPQKVTEMTEDLVWDMVHVNCIPVVIITKMILPQMQKKRKGAVINISSIVDMQPVPFIAVYTATKAFVTVFTKALQLENRGSGITIQILSPGLVNTNMTKSSRHILPESFMAPNATNYVKQAIGTLGILNHSAGYYIHSILMTFLRMIPMSLRSFLIAPVFKMFRDPYEKELHDN